MEKRLLLASSLCAIALLPNCHKPEIITINNDNDWKAINRYPIVMKLNNINYNANITLVLRDPLSSDSCIWILQAAWADTGLVVQIETAKALSVNSFLSGYRNKTLEDYCVSTRLLQHGEMKFLEKKFIQSLPLILATNGLDTINSVPLYIRITPGWGLGGILGQFWVEEAESGKSNMGYAKLAADFRSAIPWAFAEWLIEDGFEIDEAWLAKMKTRYPKRRLN